MVKGSWKIRFDLFFELKKNESKIIDSEIKTL